MKTIILGKSSFLTKNLKKNIKDLEIFSARQKADIPKIIKEIEKFKKFNLIFNNFYPSNKLNSINDNLYKNFYDQSLNFNWEFLNLINKKKINKIIYTSSSSVYNSISSNPNHIDGLNRKLYSSVKLSSETLLHNFCSKNNINYIITRLFNIYGDSDIKFSFIDKLIESYNKKITLKVHNDGNDIRDFIHIDDVVNIYLHIIKNVKKNMIVDVGTGQGIKIIDIIYLLQPDLKFKKIKLQTKETENSIASLNTIKEIYKNFKPTQLEEYLKKKLNYKTNKNLEKFYKQTQNSIQDVIEGYIIYGAGNAGQQIYDRLIFEGKEVYCFVDDLKFLKKKLIKNTKVISFAQLTALASEKIINNIVIAIPSLNSKKLKILKNKLKSLSSNLTFLPNKKNLMSDYVSLSDINSDQISDFLNRKVIITSQSKFKNLNNKVVLVTGAAGSIGSELCRQLAIMNVRKIIAVDNSEFLLFNLKNELNHFKDKFIFCLDDVTNSLTFDHIIKRNKAHYIFHAAAYKHVAFLEENILSAIKNNIFGTLNVIESSIKNNCNLVIISTDKAVKPTTILGLTKRICEILPLKYKLVNPKININVVRFGNVFGSLGSAVPRFIDQLNKNLPITLTHKNVTRFFMTIKEACYLVLETTELKSKNNTFVLNMGKRIKIIDIINKLIKIKKNFNPKRSYNIEEVGLYKGEKLHEILSLSKTFKTKNPNISSVNDPYYDSSKVNNLIETLEQSYVNMDVKKLTIIMKNFLKNEY